jgi:hypothetical protein
MRNFLNDFWSPLVWRPEELNGVAVTQTAPLVTDFRRNFWIVFCLHLVLRHDPEELKDAAASQVAPAPKNVSSDFCFLLTHWAERNRVGFRD